MNTSGRATKSLIDDSTIQTIKAPESIIHFLAKIASRLTNMREDEVSREVRKVITRYVNDQHDKL